MPKAAFKVIPFCFIKYAATTVGEREMPAEQWTRIFPVSFLDVIAPSMISQAASAIFEMEDEAESLRERRWYVTPLTFVEGLAVLVMCRLGPEALSPPKPTLKSPAKARPCGGLFKAQGSGFNL